MAWKKYINIWNILLLALTVSLGFFGMRWYNGKARIGPPEEYHTIDDNWPTLTANSTLVIDHSNIDTLLGHTGNGTSWENAYIFEDALLTEYADDQGRITLSIYNVTFLIIRNVRFEPDSGDASDGLVLSECDNIIIGNCYFKDCDDAIRVDDSTGITIENNSLYSNYYGMYIDNSSSTIITDNDLMSHDTGIWVKQSDNTDTLNNTIVDSGRSIYYEDTDYGEIAGNIMMYSQGAATIFIDEASGYNTVQYNTFIDCVFPGIGEDIDGDNTIENNPEYYSRKIIGLILTIAAGVPLLTLIALLIRAGIKQRSVTKQFKKTKKIDDFWVFFSYATVNSKMYRVPELAKRLEIYEDIDEVFYWEQKMTDDIFEYMERYIKDCNVILLFCSKEAIASEAVKKEWMSSLKIDKKIIPIFKDPEDIPALLTTKLGVQFNPDDFDKYVNDVYALIKKKTQSE